MTKPTNILLSELLRPRQLSDLTLPQQDIARLESMLASGNIMNMIFHGRPGIGKTSAARAIIKTLKADFYELNGSSRKCSSAAKLVEQFATCTSLIDAPKICFIDEADFLSRKEQASLRHLIENTSNNCRYLFTANHVGKINDALQSRMKIVCFDVASLDRSNVIDRLIKRYQEALPLYGIKYDERRLREIVGIYFPDLRTIANEFEYEFVDSDSRQ